MDVNKTSPVANTPQPPVNSGDFQPQAAPLVPDAKPPKKNKLTITVLVVGTLLLLGVIVLVVLNGVGQPKATNKNEIGADPAKAIKTEASRVFADKFLINEVPSDCGESRVCSNYLVVNMGQSNDVCTAFLEIEKYAQQANYQASDETTYMFGYHKNITQSDDKCVNISSAASRSIDEPYSLNNLKYYKNSTSSQLPQYRLYCSPKEIIDTLKFLKQSTSPKQGDYGCVLQYSYKK